MPLIHYRSLMPNSPALIGVTGGIGAGKSVVCKILEVMGHKVYYADDRAKWLMQSDPSLVEDIKSIFGEDAYEGDKLNRTFIAERAFRDPELLTKLNARVHPAVANDLSLWRASHKDETLLFDEAALLFETGSYKKMNATILVVAPKALRIERVLTRDPHRSKQSIEDIIDKQMSDEDKVPLADFLLHNDGKTSVIKQTMEIYQRLLNRHK